MAWTAFIDGGSRGNPGPAGAGIQISDPAGSIVFAGGVFLGTLTNNQAEYRSLLIALDLLTRAKAKDIAITSDSQLMVRQLTGQYRVKSPGLKPLFEQAREKLSGFDHWEVGHVFREKNASADRLANKAMDVGRNVVATDSLALAGELLADGRGDSPQRPASGAVEVLVVREPKRKACPGGLRRGQSFMFTDVTPPDLCVEACGAVIEAVLALREADEECRIEGSTMTVSCGKPNCGAAFEVRRH